MKSLKFIFLTSVMALLCGCGGSGGTATSSRVVIAVNTEAGIGYFMDSEGSFLFGRQFEGVGSFSEGLAGVQQNGKWGFINTKGEVVIPCVYDGMGNTASSIPKARWWCLAFMNLHTLSPKVLQR